MYKCSILDPLLQSFSECSKNWQSPICKVVLQHDGCYKALNQVFKIYIAKAPSSGAITEELVFCIDMVITLHIREQPSKRLDTGGDRQTH